MAFLAALDWPIRIVLGVVVAGALGTGIVLAVRTSGGDDAQVAGQLTGTPPTLAPAMTAGSPTAALTVTPAPPTQTPPAPTQEPPTQPPAPTTDPDCAKRMHNHLNIAKLQTQPGLEDAVFTEIDYGSIRGELDGVEFIIFGWGEDTSTAVPPGNDQLAAWLRQAVDALRYEC